jgi:hypothetical protein
LSDYTLDSRESNQHFCTEALTGQWERIPMKLSTFIILDDDQEDMDCGDLTNENRDGIVEFKEFGDFVSSCIPDKNTPKKKRWRLHKQVRTMQSTGFPYAVIIYGSEWVYLKKSSVSYKKVRQSKQHLSSLMADPRYSFTVYWCKDEGEALEDAISFLDKKCRRLPRGWPSRDLLPQVREQLFKGWGYDKTSLFFKHPDTNTIADLMWSMKMFGENVNIRKYEYIKGLGETTIKDFYKRCNTDLKFEKQEGDYNGN